MLKPDVIVCAAVRRKNGLIVAGPRHFDATMRQLLGNITPDQWDWGDQGFLDQRGKFYSRTEAWKIAQAAGQIKYRVGSDTVDGGTLFSENLY